MTIGKSYANITGVLGNVIIVTPFIFFCLEQETSILIVWNVSKFEKV